MCSRYVWNPLHPFIQPVTGSIKLSVLPRHLIKEDVTFPGVLPCLYRATKERGLQSAWGLQFWKRSRSNFQHMVRRLLQALGKLITYASNFDNPGPYWSNSQASYC